MAVLLRDDPTRAGFALLRLDPAPAGPLAVTIQFLDRTYLGPDGRRTRERHLFAAEPQAAPGIVALGPAVTAHVREAEIVTLADASGAVLGTVAWEGIRPPPGSGRGARVGEAGGASSGPASSAVVRPAARHAVPVEGRTGAGAPEALPPPPGSPATPEPVPAMVQPRPRRRLRRAALGGCAALGLLAGLGALVMSGRIGWEVSPEILVFTGRQGETAQPPTGEARLRARWYAKPFAALARVGFQTEGSPPWVGLHQAATAGGAVLQVTPAVPAIAAGEQRMRVSALFPVGGAAAGLGVDVVMRLEAPPVPPPAPPPASPVDDAACDRAAGSRFDPDHPAGVPSVDEVFDLPAETVAGGIAACDPRTDRTGPDRRLLVQRGRLLAARALSRAATGDLTGARRDMDEALAAWQAGSTHGSAFADSLLGSYAFGSFNRPALAFVRPDDAAAAAAWKRGGDRGSVIAQRNYAAQLMGGRGVPADPSRAVALLRDAIAHGDERAAGVLGVALYTGFPPGVPADKAEGWTLIVRAQCADKSSADLLAAEIAAGARAPGDRRACR